MAVNKLSKEQWADIQIRYEVGEKVKDLAAEYGIKSQAISLRAKRKGWRKHGELTAKAKEEAKVEVTESIKSSYIENAEKDKAIYSNLYRKGMKACNDNLDVIIAEQEDEAKRRLAGEKIPFNRLRAYSLTTVISGMRQCIDGDMDVRGYKEIKPEREDPGLDRLFNVLKEAREEAGIVVRPVGG